ncbi:ParA family protein [Desulfobacterales bacterium HSG2]|nr:ParA family protein [Desulfobacterales bacterium HSG2]
MITISLINMKGGVGKTTLAVNLGWNLARRKNKVLIIDLDPQFNASQYIMDFQVWDQHRKNKGTIADILSDTNPQPRQTVQQEDQWFFKELHIVETNQNAMAGLWLIPSDLRLAYVVKNPQGVEYRLYRRMQYWKPYFDYIFIDCAPEDTILTSTALMCSDFIFIPVKPDRFSVVGYGNMQEVIDAFRYDYPDPQKVQDLGVVFNQVKGDSDIEEECKELVSEKASYVFETEVKSSTSHLRALKEGTPLFDTKYARKITKKTMDSLVDEMEARINTYGG